MNKTFYIGICTVFLMLITSAIASNAMLPGQLDTTFGTNGVVSTTVATSNNWANAVAIQTDGKIVTVGFGTTATNNAFTIVRYHPDGSLDSTFNGNGISTAVVGTANGIAIQQDGKIMVVGHNSNFGNLDFKVVRYNANGTLDSTFDADGIVTTPILGGADVAFSVVTQTDGKIVVSGRSDSNPSFVTSFAMVRYNANGSLDNTFDGDGIVIVTGPGNAITDSLAIQADGKIVVGHNFYNGSAYRLAVLRYNTDGSPDASFDGDGSVVTTVGTNVEQASVAIQPNGKIVVACSSYTSAAAGYDFWVVRYNTDGSTDSTFGNNGLVITPIGTGSSFDIPKSIAIQTNGRIVVGGKSPSGFNDNFAAVRYNSDGSLDNTWGTAGIVTSDLGGNSESINAIAIQSDGRIVATGESDVGNPGARHFATVRFLGDPPPAAATVINNSNSGAGSLRQAILNANPGDTINFAANVTGSIFLASPLVIDKDLTINGPGANVLGVEGRDQPTESNVFNVSAGTATISGLRIANGFSSGAGGGVLVEGGNLKLNNCLIIGNTAESAGGVFVGNGSTLTITNSTISGNTSFVEGGGVSNRGGTLMMTNSTVSGNNAQGGGGIASGLFAGSSVSTILNSTISNNTGDIGGLAIGGGSVVNLKNTIIAGNIGSTTVDVAGTVSSQGTNLIGNTTGSSGFIPTDLQNISPLLGPLGNNGGTTLTMALAPGSPAIDAGNNAGAPATDQRGAARPQGAAVDIGSFESGIPSWSGQTDVGSNVNAILGTVSVTFFGVSTAGTTTQVPIDPAGAGTLLPDYSFGPGYPAYDISTTASYTAPITVCLQVPGVANVTVFKSLALLHNEGGVLIDHTVFRDFATRTICANVSSLSPFAVANDLTPSAASVSVGGRVLTANGGGISKVNVTLTDAAGMTRTALTNPFGYYRFDDVAAGQTYLISIRSKTYHFANPTQVATVDDEIADLDFIATPLAALRSYMLTLKWVHTK